MYGLIFKELANYNKISNEKLNAYLENISEDQWNKNFNGHYKSIQELCLHNTYADHYLLKVFKSSRDFISLNKKILENELQFNCINEYIKVRNELDDIINEFVNELTPDDWERLIKFPDVNDMEFKLGPEIISMFNHEVHNRGMISIYLEYLGIENEF